MVVVVVFVVATPETCNLEWCSSLEIVFVVQWNVLKDVLARGGFVLMTVASSRAKSKLDIEKTMVGQWGDHRCGHRSIISCRFGVRSLIQPFCAVAAGTTQLRVTQPVHAMRRGVSWNQRAGSILNAVGRGGASDVPRYQEENDDLDDFLFGENSDDDLVGGWK